MTNVGPATEKKLRDAMERLLAGKAKRTDGRLTKANLHTEAGISRATMNRATAVIADWNAAVDSQTAPRDSKLVGLEETVTKLRQTITKLRDHNADLERRNKAAVTVIAELSAQLRSARGENPTGTVTPLRKGRSPGRQRSR
ncbi:hypothetical protein [Mycolicibacterium pyrenivorans]|uniref:hypothetical protein n=1 Tax=Mycolicibacterium pyrenivorans TaxID=187102 RepID=UPI0021F25753|nr:hypothetical protein [Mycolicibacterium pyrenivorans]MCV7153467.1 hypothetical protein [Mycolicibacterium pyrenivorans]